jgi:RNA polymerase sigma factor (sigma-70 family)
MSFRLFLQSLGGTLREADSVSDRELLQRYAGKGDSTAFELIVRRHAEMVWTVCRSVSDSDFQASEDAFQATFLALARRAGAIRDESSAGWLFRVARNAALRARKRPSTSIEPRMELAEPERNDRLAETETSRIVCEEVSQLTEKFRTPVLLCFFEGMTHVQAARHLGWSVGTVASRLARAKDRLRETLSRRGITLPAAGFGSLLLQEFVPQHAKSAIPLNASVSVQTLTTEVLRTMRLTQLKTIATISMAVLLMTGMSSLFLVNGQGDPKSTKPSAKAPAGFEVIESDIQLLQGKWRPVRLISDGKEGGPKDLPNAYWEFTGKTIIMVDDPSVDTKQGANFTVDAGKSPKQMDITATTGDEKFKSKPMLCAYRLDDDVLTIVLCSPEAKEQVRPKKVEPHHGPDVAMIVLERMIPSKVKPMAIEKAQANAAQLKLLQGRWQPYRFVSEGKVVDPKGGEAPYWEISDQKIAMESGKGASTFAIDATQTPKHLDMTYASGNTEFDGKTVMGIYELKGDELIIRMCHPTDPDPKRPTSLSTDRDARSPMIVMKRIVAKVDPATDGLAEGVDAFQGDWKFTQVVIGGKPIDAVEFNKGGRLLKIRGSQIQTTTAGAPEPKEFAIVFAVDHSTTPKQINWTFVRGGHPSIVGQMKPGIYRFEEGRLEICFGPEGLGDAKRPKEFVSLKGSGNEFYVLEKVPAKK